MIIGHSKHRILQSTEKLCPVILTVFFILERRYTSTSNQQVQHFCLCTSKDVQISCLSAISSSSTSSLLKPWSQALRSTDSLKRRPTSAARALFWAHLIWYGVASTVSSSSLRVLLGKSRFQTWAPQALLPLCALHCLSLIPAATSLWVWVIVANETWVCPRHPCSISYLEPAQPLGLSFFLGSPLLIGFECIIPPSLSCSQFISIFVEIVLVSSFWRFDSWRHTSGQWTRSCYAWTGLLQRQLLWVWPWLSKIAWIPSCSVSFTCWMCQE